MRKIMAIVAALMMLLAFAACSSKDCEVCGAKGEGDNKVEYQGETAYLCDDCESLFNIGVGMMQ